MGFDVDKSEVIRVPNKKRPLCSDNNIHNQKLNIKTEAKHMGVTISSDLSWSRHADNVAKKANSTMGFLKRNMRSAPQAAKATAYKTFVGPIVEYAATTWAPSTDKIQMVHEEQPDLLQVTTAEKAVSKKWQQTLAGTPFKSVEILPDSA